VVVSVAGEDKSGSDNVVSKHLPVVLTALLNVDDNHLLQPERPLAEKVSLHDPIKLAVGPVGPEVLHAHVVRRGAVDVLCLCQRECFPHDRFQTYHSPRPKDSIINHEPSLLAETGQVLAVGDALKSADGRKNVFHGGGAKAGEKNNAEGDEVGVIVTDTILSRFGVKVAKVEEFLGVFSSFGDESLREEDKAKEVERKT
jgi:hypothetical protein